MRCPAPAGGIIPKGPPNPYRKGRPWDPSVVADTRQRPCYWTQDTYGVARIHVGLCRGRDYSETNRPPPPRSAPHPTYTQEVWDAIPQGDRALVATTARWPLSLEDEHGPLIKGVSLPLAASPAPADSSSVAGYAAAASSRVSGAAHPAQLVVAPRPPHAQPPSRRARIVVQPAPQ